MKKYQVTWGWQPPQYDMPGGNFRLFYHSEERTRDVSRKNIMTGEVTIETITEWLCDVVEYEGPEASEILRLLKEDEQSLGCQKWMLNAKIEAYDSSRHVNEFTIGGVHVWLDKSTRVGLALRFEAEVAAGKTETALWYNGMNFTLPLKGDESSFALLYAIELYASACYDNTQQHYANVYKLESVEDVVAYDYTTGYPPKLAF